MEIGAFIERLHEAENLTDNLEDAEARWLLDWGTAQLTGLVGDAPDADTAGARVSALMKFMRRLNRLSESLPNLEPDDLSGLLDQYTQTFGAARSVDAGEHGRVVATLAKMPVREALAFLIEWAAPAK